MTMSSPFLYKTFARRETHPARLGALARLQGLQAASAGQCSLFEIGCGDGGNLIPLAAQYPNVKVVDWEAEAQQILGELSTSDGGIHLRTAYAKQFYANLIFDAIGRPDLKK